MFCELLRNDVISKQLFDCFIDCYFNLVALDERIAVGAPKDRLAVLVFENIFPPSARGFVGWDRE